MSLGSQSFHQQLNHEIEKRIGQESPTKYDLDFYQRKIVRLQNDLNDVQDELSRARVRLRRAEDFQIKYQLLMKQNSNLISDNDLKEKQYFDLKAKFQLMKAQVRDKHNEVQDFTGQKQSLLKEIQKWKTKCEESEDQRRAEFTKNEENVDKKIKRQVEAMKKDFMEREERYQEQIRQLKKQIHEKSTVQNVVVSKVDRVRNQKDEEIKRLSKNIETKKKEFEEAMNEKNQEIDRIREKFEQVFNFQIENLHKTFDDQDELFSIEINGLRELLSLKNDEIHQLLEEVKNQSATHQAQRDELQQDINNLKEKIYQIQRENQLQLYNVKQRLSKIHSLQIDTLQKRYSDLISSLKNEKANLEKILKQKESLMEAEREDLDRVKQQLYERLKEKQARITQLLDRLKETGDTNQNQMKTLHESFHQIETQKQNLASQYQNNVGFLNQQITKLVNNNELKIKEVRQLHEEISRLKRAHAEIVKDLQDRWKQQRKQRQLQRERERQKRERISEDFRLKERDWKHRERDLERQKQQQERQKLKFEYMVEQLQKDIQRLNKYNKQLDDSLKQEYKKNQMSTLDAGGVRRELNSQLQKQKCELQAIKRMQVDQISSKFELQLTKLRNQKEKLETDLLKKQIAYDELASQFKKLEHISKNIEKINKQKMIEYQKKMATLNNEINLTQNLYEAFMKTKARSQRSQSP